MKHAGPDALASLEPVLSRLRRHSALVERTPGTFYRQSKAFLHFHEDDAGLFADLKEDLVSFSRHRVTTQSERKVFLARVNQCLSALARASRNAQRKLP